MPSSPPDIMGMATKDGEQTDNPATGKDYAVRQKTTKSGKRGKVKGLWKSQGG